MLFRRDSRGRFGCCRSGFSAVPVFRYFFHVYLVISHAALPLEYESVRALAFGCVGGGEETAHRIVLQVDGTP
jgi:hypothetical protein